MLETTGNLFDCTVDAICITTNGVITSNGVNVMGAGCARTAKIRWPSLPQINAGYISASGHQVHLLTRENDSFCYVPSSSDYPEQEVPYHILAFPTKDHWKAPSSLDLIEKSAEQLVFITDSHLWEQVAIPRPGCGLGQLSWSEVKSRLVPILDDRFHIITFSKRKRG